jgi:hypothetical protein
LIRSLPLLLLVGCVTETGNPELDVHMAVSGTSSDERVAIDHVPSVTIDAAYTVIDDVRLVQGDACDAPGEVEFDAEGPFAIDLLAADPFVVDIPAATGDYCRLRVRLDRADGAPDGLPAGMDDHAVYIEGRRVDHTPFVIRSRERFEVDLRSRGAPFPLDTGTDRLVLAFDLGVWLADIDLDSGTPGGDGVLRIDEDYEEGLLEAFEARVEAVMSLHDDRDGDGAAGYDDPTLAD